MSRFKHLNTIKMNYNQHFKNSIYYSFTSLKASYYFLIHSIYPDIYTTSGTNTVRKLNNLIEQHAHTTRMKQLFTKYNK